MARRPRNTVTLTDGDRATLLSWSRSRIGSRALAQRAQILLACEQEPTSTAVAEQLGVSRGMVGKWCSRYLAEGLEGLTERPRPGRPSKVNEDTTARVLLRSLTPPPTNRREWSTRSMAAETGLSQKTVNRIWRTYRLGSRPDQPPSRPAEGHDPLASTEVCDVVGLLLDPPVRVLAVIADDPAASRRKRRATAPTNSSRTNKRCSEARNVLALANAFALVRGPANAPDPGSPVRAFLENLGQHVPAGLEVHLLVGSEPNTSTHDAIETWVRAHQHFHQHLVATDSSWLEEVERLLASNPPLSHENVLGSAASATRLRDNLHAWCSAWAPDASPLAWTRTPRVPGTDEQRDTNKGSAASKHAQESPPVPTDHHASEETTNATHGTANITDQVAQLVREALITGRFRHGERVKEAPLAARLGVSRGPVRETLRVLAEQGMLERLPKRGTAVPHVDATAVLDLYAARSSLGTVLMRQVATLRRSELRSVSTALAEVRAAARQSRNDHARIGDADLRFQDAIAQTAYLPQVSLFFQRLTMRLRMFISVLQLEFADAGAALIARENAEIFKALRHGDGDEAARLWRVKLERSVRYMTAYLPQEHFDPDLWATVTGKPTSTSP